MTTPHQKIDKALKRIIQIRDLIKDGLARQEEKLEAFRLAGEAALLFTNDILKRKAEKIGKKSYWTKQTGDGFVSVDEADHLSDWIRLLEEYKESKKIKAELASDKVHIQSVVDGEDQHIFITEKGSKEHAHLILDSGTGEIRIDPKDKPPHDLIRSIEAKLELKTGETVQVTKTALTFAEPEAPKPDVRAYTATKDSYFVIELYNNGDEDLEDFRVLASWIQPEGPQQRVMQSFNDITDYLVMAHPRSLNMLPKGMRVYVNNVPTISTDKKIKITISCRGMRSGKSIERVFDLETPNQYR